MFTEVDGYVSIKNWSKSVYKSSSMIYDQNVCGYYCTNVEKQNGCDSFLFSKSICYFANSTHTSGEVLAPDLDSQLHLTNGKSIKEDFRYESSAC